MKKDFEGTTPPAVFIGSKLKYPEVNVGILSLQEINNEAWKHNSPNYWSNKNESIKEIVRLRQRLINSKIRKKNTRSGNGNTKSRPRNKTKKSPRDKTTKIR